VDSFRAIFGWVTGHEQLLSGLAAMVVIAGVVVSPLGHGLRALFFRSRERLVADPRASSPPPPPPVVTDRPSIAVLPFTNMSDDREQEFLADGMTEDIITGLSLSRSLFVIARNSTFSYKGKSPNVRDVGRELGVRNVLEGSVRRIGENLRVTAQLIDAASGAHLWAQAFDRPLADIFKMQDEITAGIVAALTTHLTHAIGEQFARARPESLEAWQLFHRALAHFVAGLDGASQRNSEAWLRTAVKKDPAYAPAWVWLGFTIACRWLYQPELDPAEDRQEAGACIDRALRLAPSDPEVLALQGAFLTVIGRPLDGVRYLEQATQINPNEALYRVQMARALCFAGRGREALVQIEAALRLSPRDPYMGMYALDMAFVLLTLGRNEEAETWARQSFDGSPNVYAGYSLALAIARQGRAEEARQVLRETLRVPPGMTLDRYLFVLRNLGYDEAYVADARQHLAAVWPTGSVPGPAVS
jgi:TolB-like protein/Flp pilus assembly protein TadD